MRLNRSNATLLILLTTVTFSPASTDAQVPDTGLKRVLELKVADYTGSAFTIEVDGRQYLITAKHLVAGLKAKDTVEIRMDDGWGKIKVRYYPCDDPIDVAVLIADYQLTASSVTTELTFEGARFGQESYFLGFPYDEFFITGGAYNDHHPVPFIKRATISGAVPEGSGGVLYLDGYNNPGFSGGPIIYRDLSRTDYVIKVAGVVSGFFPEIRPVMNSVEVQPQEDLKHVEPWRIVTKNGKKYKLVDTEQSVATNTGIVKGYTISSALDLIKKHPDGPKVDVPPQQAKP